MFDLRSISLAVGEQHRQHIAVAIAPFTIGGVAYRSVPGIVDAVRAATRLRNGWVFDEDLVAHVHGPCHRCLEPAVVELAIDAQEFHALKPEPGAEEEMSCEYLVDDRLDTDRLASDAVVLAMPVQVVCRPDCAGLCPRCGANLNEGPCGCPVEQIDERWGPLKGLLDDVG